jgi:hypothetical protein
VVLGAEVGILSPVLFKVAIIAGIGWLYEVLPEESRDRPVDPSGVMELHRCLAVLDAGPES